LWGQALVTTLDGLAAGVDGDAAAADAAFATAAGLGEQASAIRTIPGETRPEGPVRVGDGVLDEILEEARGLVLRLPGWLAWGGRRRRSVGTMATAIAVEGLV